MPKHVWLCDHCCETNESLNKIKTHEEKCSFNPKNKYCYTCSNHLNEGFWIYGESYKCSKGLNMDHCEDNGNCEGWNCCSDK